MNTVVVDWALFPNYEAFFDSVLEQTEAPEWHLRSLDAIRDSWVTGDICAGGPPFLFVFRNHGQTPTALKDFAETVAEIARESVRIHGGGIVNEE